MNLLSRGTFRHKKFQIPVQADPGITVKSNLSLGNCILSVEKLSWKYAVDSTDKRVASNGYGWPKVPLRVTIDPMVREEVTPPEDIKPCVVYRDSLNILVTNPSDIPVTLNVSIEGTIIELFDGCEISNLEIMGYSMLEDSHKGMLALNQAASQQGQLTEGNLRLMGAALETSRRLELPEPKEPLNKDEQVSLLIGDIVRFKTSLTIENIESLSEQLIARGWRREPRQ